eukprot:c14224_g1_i1 orf=95-532(-)
MVVVSSSEGKHKLDAKGVPSFAYPWLEMGRLEEREKWQKLAMELMETSICSELADLRGTVTTTLPTRLPELKQNINTKVDDAQERISQLIAQYKKFFLEESQEENPHCGNPNDNKNLTPNYQPYEEFYKASVSTSEIVAASEDDD